MPSVALTLTARTSTGTFTNPLGAIAVGGDTATWTGADVGNLYVDTNALAVVPAGSVVVGAFISVRATCTSLSGTQLHLYTGQGFGLPIGIQDYSGTTLAYYYAGGTAQNFGVSDPAEWAGFRYRAWGDGASTATHTVDAISITLHYEAAGGYPTMFMNENF